MYREVDVAISAEDAKSSKTIIPAITKALDGRKLPSSTILYRIAAWQTGDFGHVYAAMVCDFMKSKPAALIVLHETGANMKFLKRDIEFALKLTAETYDVDATVLYVAAPERAKLITVLTSLTKYGDRDIHEPYDATFRAQDIVQRMAPGQPLTPVWADFSRGIRGDHAVDFEGAVQAFMGAYLDKFTASTGREKFVCLWGRTSGGRKSPTDTGGANPQYDSSELGNQQLCLYLKHTIPSIKAVLIIGAGFNDETRNLPHVFDLGEFWKKFKLVAGRFQENGFFDYMTAVYNCDVVHLGMKSGGMDTLGLWGQKVVFIDSVKAPGVTRGRVAAWASDNLKPVDVEGMPTATGKAIEKFREVDPTKAPRTTVSKSQWAKVDEIVKTEEFDDLFENEALDRISKAVAQMFG